jgi:uncharacterized protein YfdQ (DUF2303 family)
VSVPEYDANEARVIIETATKACEPHLLAEDYVAFVHPHSGVHEIDLHDVLERRNPQPERTKGVVSLATVEELGKYVDEFYSADATTVWVGRTDYVVSAVLNDAHGTESGWRDHRATCTLQLTSEWRHWRALDGKLTDQESFADHIEEGLPEIIDPDGADLLELAQSFHATTQATFRSARRLSSGETRLQYDEETQASAGVAGDMAIPEKFALRLAVFEGEQPVALTARLRYRLNQGKLSLGYRLIRPDDAVRDTLDLIAEGLRSKFARVYLGEPR